MFNKRLALHQKLAIIWVLTSIIGCFIIYSASFRVNIANGASPYASVLLQVVLLVIMIIFLIFSYRFKKGIYNFIKRTTYFWFYFTLISLAVILVLKQISLALGLEELLSRNGAYQVIPLIVVNFDFQPLELFKITLLLFFGATIGGVRRTRTLRELIINCGIIFVGAAMILLQPDTGGFIIVVATVFCLVIANGAHLGFVMKWTAVALVAIAVFFSFTVLISNNNTQTTTTTTEQSTGDYRSCRIKSYTDPFGDPEGCGSNIINSVLAISNGGLTGVGYLQSIQSSGYLFGSSTDFIFSIVCEEFGILGALFIIGLLFSMSYYCFRIARGAYDRYGQLVAYGVGFLILIQTAVNIGGVTGVIPMTGVTLPFISSGINSYLFLSLGIVIVILIDLEAKRKSREKQNKIDSLFL